MKIAVVGSGAWGTALAVHLCAGGHDVVLWTYEADLVAQMEQTRSNPRLPGVILPPQLKISAQYDCVSGNRMVVIATPSFPIRQTCRNIAPYLDKDALMVCVTKGLEPGTLLRMSQVVAEETGKKVVVLTGPSHAEELARKIPTGCVAACEDQSLAEIVQDVFMADCFRVYTGSDVIGAELGAALKNVIAMCAGVTDGLGCGDNTKAMLMTRGLTEMARLGVSLGAKKETFTGLAGVGDLIVTCTSMHSRNRRAGILIGQGVPVEEAMKQVGAVVEGYYAARSAWELCRKQNVEMPILQAAYSVLYEGVSAEQAVLNLLRRGKKSETEDVGWL